MAHACSGFIVEKGSHKSFHFRDIKNGVEEGCIH
jgi:hypothetical protein